MAQLAQSLTHAPLPLTLLQQPNQRQSGMSRRLTCGYGTSALGHCCTAAVVVAVTVPCAHTPSPAIRFKVPTSVATQPLTHPPTRSLIAPLSPQVVLEVLLSAARQGKRFRVMVVDSRPELEGRQLMRRLLQVGTTAARQQNSHVTPV